jgi:hypothetical protein
MAVTADIFSADLATRTVHRAPQPVRTEMAGRA